MATNEEQTQFKLDFVEKAMLSGNVVLVLGANTSAGSKNQSGGDIPSFTKFISSYTSSIKLSAALSSSTHDDIIAYANRNQPSRNRYRELLRAHFSAKIPAGMLRIIPNFVWRRIYTFDISDALELAYRQNHRRQQTPLVRLLEDPVSRSKHSSPEVHIVKLFGDALHEESECYLSAPGFIQRSTASQWFAMLSWELSTYQVVFCGEAGDDQILVNALRQLRDLRSAQQNAIVISPDVSPLQQAVFEESGIAHIAYPSGSGATICGDRLRGDMVEH